MKARLLTRVRLWSFVALMAAFSYSQAQEATIEGDGAKGYELFDKNCTACHQIDGTFIGPEIRGLVQRIEKESGLGREWIHKWIKDNKALRESGDVYGNKIFEQYDKSEMLAFPEFTEQDIDDILTFSNDPEAGQKAYEDAQKAKKEAALAAKAAKKSSGAGTGAIVVGFAILAILLVWILTRVNALVKLSNVKELSGEEKEKIRSLSQLFEVYKSKALGGLVVLTLAALYGAWVLMIGIGVDKGYEPVQPVFFSHSVHAGAQSIDCQYCHSSAKYGKVSGIPSTDVCMNCHKTIKEYKGDYYDEELVNSGKFSDEFAVKDFYTAEIQKMYAAIGWDPKGNTYTGEQKPIEWVRIHNMPDFVYFSHAQHVVAGEKAILKAMGSGTIPNAAELNVAGTDQACYACHGRVDQMAEVKMANDFTMGWCIECHRTTEVDMENEYNKEYYAQLHDKLKKQYGDATQITVDAIGGLECAKCHY